MRYSRSLILIILAGLTVCFLGAAYAMWFNTNTLALIGADDPATPSAAATTGSSEDNTVLRLTVPESGVTMLKAAQLRNAGLPFIELSSADLRLTHNGDPVPFIVRDVAGEPALLFFAHRQQEGQEPDPVYILQQGPGVAMTSRPAGPQGPGSAIAERRFVWEENAYFVENADAKDAWMGPLLLAPARWTLALDGVHPDGGPATLQLQLFSTVDDPGTPDHHITLRLNGRDIAEHVWDGPGPETITVPLDEGVLRPTAENMLEVAVHDQPALMGESIYIDAVELLYEGVVDASEQAAVFSSTGDDVRLVAAEEDLLVLDISDPEAPALLTSIEHGAEEARFHSGGPGKTFVALPAASAQQPELEAAPQWEDSLRDPRWAADYIAIVADVRGFATAVDPLLAHRQEQGLRVAAVPLDQVFDEFAHGHRDPQAIRDFLAYAADTWTSPAPRYVLLVGDATHDVTDRFSGRNRNRLPTAMIHSDESGYVASDGWFAMGEDGTPLDMAIGRLPAQNAPQLSAMVDKIIAYESTPSAEAASWAEDALLIQEANPAYQAAAESLAGQLDANGFRVYRMQAGPDDMVRHGILSAMNEGVGLVSYLGHGSETAWGDDAVLQGSDVQSLQNGARLPVLSTFTCRSGSFANPLTDSLAESLLRASQGGIIAGVAPSGHIPAEQQLPLAAAFHAAYVAGESTRLGDMLLAMHAQADTPALRAAMLPVNLLGDPALQVHLP